MTDASWRSNKRSKIDQAPEEKSVDISSASQLHDLLYFRQSTSPDVKNGQYLKLKIPLFSDKYRYKSIQAFFDQYCK